MSTVIRPTALTAALVSLAIATSAAAEDDAIDARFARLIDAVTAEDGYHFNDRWPRGVRAWSKACPWADDGLVEDRERARACRELEVVGTASIVRDEHHNGAAVVQELWLLRYEDAAAARRGLCAMRAMAYGPFHKRPARLYLYGEREVIGVEGRFRFPRFQEELAARVEALEGVTAEVACKKK